MKRIQNKTKGQRLPRCAQDWYPWFPLGLGNTTRPTLQLSWLLSMAMRLSSGQWNVSGVTGVTSWPGPQVLSMLGLFLHHQLNEEDAEDLEEDGATVRIGPVSSNDLEKYRHSLSQTLF